MEGPDQQVVQLVVVVLPREFCRQLPERIPGLFGRSPRPPQPPLQQSVCQLLQLPAPRGGQREELEVVGQPPPDLAPDLVVICGCQHEGERGVPLGEDRSLLPKGLQAGALFGLGGSLGWQDTSDSVIAAHVSL